jgi:hypothetical protein
MRYSNKNTHFCQPTIPSVTCEFHAIFLEFITVTIIGWRSRMGMSFLSFSFSSQYRSWFFVFTLPISILPSEWQFELYSHKNKRQNCSFIVKIIRFLEIRKYYKHLKYFAFNLFLIQYYRIIYMLLSCWSIWTVQRFQRVY